MFRLARAIAFALCFAAAPAGADDSVVTVETGDPAMAAAVEAARASLGKVLDVAINDQGQGHPALTLKVAFPVDAGEVRRELIWVGTISRAGGGFTGKLDNEPLYMPDLHHGDAVLFTEDMISDWGLMWASGKVFGHFTTRVLLEGMPEDQAAQVRSILSDDPLPLALR